MTLPDAFIFMRTFRLIQSGHADAATNMAVDEALFLGACEKQSVPTLRLYGWAPASFSIGVSQDARTLGLESAYVRRPTGGGALFHENELTYSLIAACADLGLSSRVKDSYEAICAFLISTYRALGLKASFAKDAFPRDTLRSHTIAPLCRMRSEEYDILINGVKCGGNAQKRHKNVFLQHGALPLDFISQAVNTPIPFEGLSKIVIDSFARHFNVLLVPGKLTQEEDARAQKCRTEKYAHDEWNRERRIPDAAALLA